MAVVEDVLATRLDILGLSSYVAGFQQAGAALNLFGHEMSAAQTKALGMGIAAGAVGAGGLAFFARAAIAAGEDAAAFQRASANFKGSFPVGDLQEFAGELERLTGIEDDAVAGALGLLGSFGLAGNAARDLAEPILNASEGLKAQGVSIEQLAVQVGKALQMGKTTALERSGIDIDQVAFAAADAAGKIRIMADALNAQGGATAARDALKTLPGSIRAATTAFGSLQEALGEPLIGPMTVAAKVMTDIANGITDLPGPVKALTTFVGVGLAGAMVVYSVKTVVAIGVTARLAAEQLKAAAAADKMALANGRAGNAAVGGAAGGKGGSKFAAGLKVAVPLIAADLALQFLPDEWGGGAGKGLKNIGNMASLGASIGSFGGVPGALAGAAIGGTVGAVQNLLPPGAPEKTEQQKQTELLAEIAKNTDPDKLPVSTSIIPGRRQMGGLEFARLLT